MKLVLTSIQLIFCLVSVSVCAAPLSISKIADGVYVHTGKHDDFGEHYDGDIANIGFVVGAESVAVVDTGGSYKVGEALRESIKAVTELPIRYVINTHNHPDHIFGNSAFEQDQPEFIGHVNLPNILEMNRDSLIRALTQDLGEYAIGSKVILPTKIVKDTMDLDLGGRILHLKSWPKAHTSTDLTVFDDKTNTLWTGDLLFISRTPSLDGDLKGWIVVIDALKTINAKVTVPGHGNPTVEKNVMLNKQSAYLNLLLTDVRASIKNGVNLMEAINSDGKGGKGDWLLFDVVNRRNVNLAYPQLEWE